jgi:two-component sensor histidine kinase
MPRWPQVQPGLSGVEIVEPVAVPPRQVVADILAPYVQTGSEKFLLAGDDLNISAQSITGIALVLHELATNAAKYGALGHPDGKLLVLWKVAEVFELDWSERGSPAAAPSRSGFGSMLVRRTVEGQFKGTIEYRWKPEGLDIGIRLPLHALGLDRSRQA